MTAVEKDSHSHSQDPDYRTHLIPAGLWPLNLALL